MWKYLQNNYSLVYTDKLEVFVTDYITIFYAYFTEARFLTCLKDSNNGLDMDTKPLIAAGKRMLTKPEELRRVTITEEDKTLNVALLAGHCGFPLKLELKLTEGSKELKVTQPFLQVIQDFKFSQQELRQELLKKDEEIEEYRCEGGEIALRHLKTIPFNEKEHMNRHTAFRSHFGSSNIFEILLQKSVYVPEMKEIKVEHEELENLPNESTVKTETKDTGATINNFSLKSEQNGKEATNIVKVETSVPETDEVNGDQPKTKTEIDVKTENVKLEQSNTRISSRPMVSPHKRKRSKLNL